MVDVLLFVLFAVGWLVFVCLPLHVALVLLAERYATTEWTKDK